MANEYPNIFALEKITNIWANEYIHLNIFEYIQIFEYSSHTGVSLPFGFARKHQKKPLNVSELGLNIILFISNLYGAVVWYIAVHSCNGNPISIFKPCYAFWMIFPAFAPRLIQSISRNVYNNNWALKRLWHTHMGQCHQGVHLEAKYVL